VLALALTGLVCSLLMGGSETMVEKERALPGRPSEMPVSDKHFVLGTPMKGPWPAGFKVAVFGNGCFWGSEKGIWRLPGGGIHSTAIGYAAGYTPNPTYEEVCSGRTGHTEAVQVVYDPSKISFVDILRWFWEAHDPTAGMGQGNDRGTQYRSGFYWTDDEQRQLIEASAAAYEAALSKKAGKPRKITTEMKAASEFDTIFYYGEDYHRARLAPPPDVARYGCSCDPLTVVPLSLFASCAEQYLAKPGARPYCSAQPQVVSLPPFEQWAPASLKDTHAPKLPDAFWTKHGPTPHCVIRSPNAPIAWDNW
jgi:peptide-methionine (S)-S-oxide reductase